MSLVFSHLGTLNPEVPKEPRIWPMVSAPGHKGAGLEEGRLRLSFGKIGPQEMRMILAIHPRGARGVRLGPLDISPIVTSKRKDLLLPIHKPQMSKAPLKIGTRSQPEVAWRR
jgi:hypothetical protein